MKSSILTALVAIGIGCIISACATDDSSPVAPAVSSYNTTPVASTTSPSVPVQQSTPSTAVPVQRSVPITAEPVYDIMVGGICQALHIVNSGYVNGACQNNATDSFLRWYSTCDVSAMHPTEYDNYTLTEIRTLLMSQFSFPYSDAQAIIVQANNCGSAMYIYSAVSGANFLYIERVGDGKGLARTAL